MTEGPGTAQNRRFAWLQAGRGLAALLVVFHHSGSILGDPRFFGYDAFGGLLQRFNVGIDFFFVLSGFIITWAHWNDFGRRDRVGSFLRKRFVRIFPPYWVVLIPLTLAYLAAPGSGKPEQHDPLNIVLSVLLLPNPQQPVLGVAWTLTFEIFFYALFACLLPFGRRALGLLGLWVIAILLAHAFQPLPFPQSFFLSPFDLEFVAGVGAAALLRHLTIPRPRLIMVAGVVAFFAILLGWPGAQDDSWLGRLAFGGAALAFVLGSVQREEVKAARLPRFVMLLGAASFAIYLTHPVSLSFGAQVLRHLHRPALSAEVGVIFLVLWATLIGVLFHLIVERPLARIVKAMFARRLVARQATA